MEELKKLRALLEHWKMHNIEHADAYLLWSEKVSDHETLSQTLVNISTESIKVNDLLNEAITQINNELAKTG